MALLSDSISGADVALYIADQGNNKIRMLNLQSNGNYAMNTFANNVDSRGLLAGLALYGKKLFCGVDGGVYAYDIGVGSASKVVYAGYPDDPSSVGKISIL